MKTTKLTSKQWEELFTGFEREALHLETRDVYAIGEEQERFHKFLARGYRDRGEEADQRRPWLTLVRDAVRDGKTIRRARIISEPVTDYIKFEWAGTDLTVEAGEEIRWLPRENAGAVAIPVNDFWLFDGKTLLLNHFSGDGDLMRNEFITDPAFVELCKISFEDVWKISIPHSEYRPN